MKKKAVVYKEKKVEFVTDDSGQVISVKDGDREVPITTGPGGIGKFSQGADIDVDLSGLSIPEVPEGTVIVTRSNPTCFWYYSRGKWRVYCC